MTFRTGGQVGSGILIDPRDRASGFRVLCDSVRGPTWESAFRGRNDPPKDSHVLRHRRPRDPACGEGYNPRLNMRIISLLNQKGGVGKTTTAVNLAAALAREGRRVVVVDLDAQANLTVHLGLDIATGAPSTYRMLLGQVSFADALHDSETPGMRVLPTDLDLSGAELELANQFGRETLLRDALTRWREEHRASSPDEPEPADYVLLDCAPSLGLLSVNALAASDEVFICVQTEFFALRGLSKLMDIVQLVQRRLHPNLRISGIVPCLYDSRLKLAREVLGELKKFFGDQVFSRSIGQNVKLAEAPSYGKTIFEYAPESSGARDYKLLAKEVLAMEAPPETIDPPETIRPTTTGKADAPAEDKDIVLVPRKPDGAEVKS